MKTRQFIAIILCCPAMVHAMQVSVGLSSDLSYSNNVSLRSTVTQDDLSQSFGLNLAALEQRKRFNLDANLNIQHERFYNNNFDDQTNISSGLGIFNFDIIHDFLDWRSSYSRAQALNNPLSSDTPDNRFFRDVFSTGPSIHYRVSRDSSFQGSLNYVYVELENPLLADSERANSSASYVWNMNPVTTVSVNANFGRILDAEGEPRVDSSSYFVGLVRQLSSGQVSASVGMNESKPEIGRSVGGAYFALSGEIEEVFSHNLTFSLGRQLSDSLIGFERNSEDGEIVLDDATTSGLDLITRRNAEIGLSRATGIFRYSFTGLWRDLDYSIQSDDQKTIGFQADLSAQIHPTLSVGAEYEYTQESFLDSINGKEGADRYMLHGSNEFTENFSMSSFIQYQKRSNPSSRSREYEEFSLGVSLQWALY